MVSPETSASPTLEALQAENARLRARIHTLESERPHGAARGAGAKARPERVLSEETQDALKDLGDRSLATFDSLGRGLIYALAESIHCTADAVNSAAQSAYGERADRHAPHDADEARDRLRDSADGLVASVAAGLRTALEGPDRVAHRFLEAYEEEKPAAKPHARSRADKG